MFWFKTIVACIGRLGITMAFEMVVFVNTELYPTFIRWVTQHWPCLTFIHGIFHSGWLFLVIKAISCLSLQKFGCISLFYVMWHWRDCSSIPALPACCHLARIASHYFWYWQVFPSHLFKSEMFMLMRVFTCVLF